MISRTICSLLLAALSIRLAGAPAPQSRLEPSPTEILERTGQYVRQLEDDFSLVISDERYEQKAVLSTPRTRAIGAGSTRTMQSEMSFMWVPDESSWLTVRSVLKVGGESVPDSRARLDAALVSRGAGRTSQLRRLRDEGARFNIGRIRRNFNDPMLGLQIADPRFQPRFSFVIAGREKVARADTLRLTFVEQGRPTIIHREDDADLPTRGDIWVGAADGIVRQTRLIVDDPKYDTRGTVVVAFTHEPKLDRWLPVRMDETYVQQGVTGGGVGGAGAGVFAERIECVATYTNYRRFETSGRLVTPP